MAEVIAEPFRAELLAMLHQISRQSRVMLGRRRVVDDVTCRLSVRPISGEDGHLLMVMVEECDPAVEAVSRGELNQLEQSGMEDELQATREHLQSLIEELATANEEMQATNEELMSLNEELNVKSGELQELNDEYTHLYDSLEFPILVFDREYTLRRYNAAAGRELKLRTTALQQHTAGNPAVERPAVMARLREATRSHHRALDHHPELQRLVRADLTRDGYARSLLPCALPMPPWSMPCGRAVRRWGWALRCRLGACRGCWPICRRSGSRALRPRITLAKALPSPRLRHSRR